MIGSKFVCRRRADRQREQVITSGSCWRSILPLAIGFMGVNSGGPAAECWRVGDRDGVGGRVGDRGGDGWGQQSGWWWW